MVATPPPVIELRSALWFTCEECGRDNWFPLVLQERGEDEEGQQFIPEVVECATCHAEFAVPLAPPKEPTDAEEA